MPYPDGFLSNRSVFEPHKYAIITPEGRVINVIPGIENCAMTILASPKLGANFVKMIGTVTNEGKTTIPYAREENVEAFLFVIDGQGSLDVTVAGQKQTLAAGGYIYAPPARESTLHPPETAMSESFCTSSGSFHIPTRP